MSDLIGGVRVVETKYGELTKVSFNETDVARLATLAKENNGWVNLNMKVGKDSGKPYLQIDTWKPKATSNQAEMEDIF